MRDVALTLVVLGLLPLCLRRPWIGILTWSWLGYMNPHRLTWSFAYSLPFAQMAALATLGGLMFSGDRKPLPREREVTLLIALWAVFLLSTVFAFYPSEAWPQFIKVSKILFMTLLTIVLMQDAERVKALLWVMALSIAFFGFKGGIWAALTGAQNQVLGPPASFIEGNTEIGLALNMVLPLLLFLRRMTTRWWLRHLLLTTFVLCILAILSTYSRGAFLGLVPVLALITLRSRAKTFAIIGIVAGLLVVGSVVPEKWFARIDTIKTYEQDGSAQARLTAWYVAFRLALDHPILGGGFRAFSADVYERYVPGWGLDTDAHNIYLQVLGEHGFTGVAVFAALLISTLVSLRSVARRTRRDPERQWISDCARTVEVSIVGYMVSGTFLSLSYFDLFYHLVAVAVLLKVLARAPGKAAAPSADDVRRRPAPRALVLAPSRGGTTGIVRPPRWFAVAVFAVTLGVASSASSQSAMSVGDVRLNLEASVRHLGQAIAGVEHRARALELNHQGYIDVRAAHERLRSLVSAAKNPDPLLEMSVPRLQTARDRVLQARHALEYPDAVPPGTAEAAMEDAIRIIQTVLLTSL